MKKATKVIVGSVMTMAMCASLITGATLALFTSEDNVNIAVTSGKASVTATPGELLPYHIDATSDERVERSFGNGGTSAETIDGVIHLTNFSPLDGLEVPITVENESTISIKYQIRITSTYEGEKDIFDALEIGLKDPTPETTKNGKTIVTDWIPVTVGGAIPGFTVNIFFPDAADNDEYKGLEGTLTVHVLAIQGNAATCAETGIHNYVDDVCTWCGKENPFTPDLNLNPSDDPNYFYIKKYTGNEENVYIPSEINGKPVAISGNSMMQGNTTVKSVTIESGITQLHQYAFDGCTSLQEVNLPDTLETLEAGTFRNCSSLKKVTIPASVIDMANKIFEGSAVEEIEFAENSKLERINSEAFAKCANLKTLSLPEHAIKFDGSIPKTMGSTQYTWMLRDTPIYDTEENWKTDEHGNQVLYLGNHLIAVKLAAETAQNNVQLKIKEDTLDIAPGIFLNKNWRSGITQSGYTFGANLEIPSSVEIISEYAFLYCSSSNKYYMGVTPQFDENSNLKYIGKSAFNSCVPFGTEATITLPASIEYIGSEAFGGSKGSLIVKMAGSDNLQYIAGDAFKACNNLHGTAEDGNGIYIGTSENPHLILAKVTDTNLQTFTVHNDTRFILGAFSSSNQLTQINLGQNVEFIGTGAFGGCSYLRQITIPASVKRIEKKAFKKNGTQGSLTATIEGEGKWYYVTTDAYTQKEKLIAIPDHVFKNSSMVGDELSGYYNGDPYNNQEKAWVRVTE